MSPKLIIIAGIVLVAILLIIRFYPLFYILITRIFFGKYSARYVETYKRFTGKSPYGYCIKDDFINYIAAFYEKKDQVQVFQSDKNITFRDTDFGTSFRKVKRKEGRLFCLNSNHLEHFDLKVLGYREKIFSHNAKAFFYFMNNRFFMGDFSFKESSKEETTELVHIISKKYLNGRKIPENNFIIEGTNNALLRFSSTGFNLTVKYLNKADPDTNEMLDKTWALTKSKNFGAPVSYEEELFNKF